MPRTLTHLEDLICNLYDSIGIYRPQQLCEETIASRLGIALDSHPERSVSILSQEPAIILDSRLNDAERWQQFGHELGHVLIYGSNQARLPKDFVDWQESKVDVFTHRFCVPVQMMAPVDRIATMSLRINWIMQTFRVQRSFASRRLQIYEIQNGGWWN